MNFPFDDGGIDPLSENLALSYKEKIEKMREAIMKGILSKTTKLFGIPGGEATNAWKGWPISHKSLFRYFY